MTTRMRPARSWPLLAAAAAVLLAGCSSPAEQPPADPPAAPAAEAPSPSSPAAALARYYAQPLDWRACDGNFECADVTVPIDYARPDAGDTSFAVVRQKPGGQPLGYLVVNPGGPGGSGIEYAEAADSVVTATVNKSYNLVGFDPRGVGRSHPVECLTNKQLDAFIAGDGDPDNARERRKLLADAKQFGRQCAARSPQLYQHVDTESVVKDLDVLRAALGSEKLNYLGFSYGTMIGALYDDEFGPNVGRMVLDGVLPPQLTADDVALGQAKAFEDTLRRYVADCQQKPDCPVAADSVDAGVQKVRDFLQSLDAKPLPTNRGRPLTQSLGVGAVLYYLYFPYANDWNMLSDGLREAFKGDGSMLLGMYDDRLQRSPDGTYKDNSQEAFYAVSCLDRAADQKPGALPALADEWAQEAPTFGRYLAWSEAVCAEWPVAATGAPRRVTGSQSAPIVLVATAHDPATPVAWAQSLAQSMANAHLIVWESDGHTAYTNGSTCIDDAVDAYLVDGTLPPPDLVCQ